MVRLLVSADIHLGSPIQSVALRNPELGDRLKQATRDVFISIIDLAISEKVDALILAGDIFDNDQPDLRTRAFFQSQVSRAADAGVPTVLIRGNHDALLNHLDQGDLGPKIHLLDKKSPTIEFGDTAFHGLSFDKNHIEKSFLPDYPLPIAGKRNVGLMHTSLDGAPGHDPYAPCATRDVMAHGYDLWCLGHIHAPFQRRDGHMLAVMPGIPQPRHFGERKGGGVALVTLGDGVPEVEYRDVGLLQFAECSLDLSSCADQQELMRTLREGILSARNPERDVAIRLLVTSDRYRAEEIVARAEELLENIDGVFLDKVKSSPPLASAKAETDDLVRLMGEEIAKEGVRQAALEQLEELRSAMPHELATVLDESELDSLLEDAIAEVSQILHSGALQ